MSLSRLRRCVLFSLVVLYSWSCADSTSPDTHESDENPELEESVALQQLSQAVEIIPSLPEVCGEPTATRLMFGEYIQTGTVEVSNDESFLYVAVRSDGGRPFLATAVFVGDSPEDIPTSRFGTPRLLSFPYRSGHPYGTTEVVWEIPLSDVSGPDAVIAVVAQVGLWPSWGEGERIVPDRPWAMYFTHSISACGGEAVGPDGGIVTSQDERASIDIPAGALSSPVEITIDPATYQDLLDHIASRGPTPGPFGAAAALMAAPLPAIEGLIPLENTIWDFGPDGTQFQLPSIVTLSYDELDIPFGFFESQLGVFVINGVIPYLPLPSMVNEAANTITAEVDHFSFFFIGVLEPGVADLAVTSLAESADRIELGQTVEYTGTVQNLGPDDISSAMVYYIGFGDLTAGPLSDGCTEIAPPLVGQAEVVCAAGALVSGASAVAPSAVFVPGSTGDFTVWSSPGSELPDPNVDNNRYEESFTVIAPQADLSIQSFSDSPDPVVEGGRVVYSIHAALDPGAEQGVDGGLLLLNPDGLASFVSATDAGCFETALGVTCPLPSMAPGLVYGVDVTLAPMSGVSNLTVLATVEAPFGVVDPDLSNNTATETTTVETGPTLFPVGQVLEVPGPRLTGPGEPPDTAWYAFETTAANQFRRIHLSRINPINGFGQLLLFSGDARIYPVNLEGRTDPLRSANAVLQLGGVGTYRLGITASVGPYRLGLGTGQGRADQTFGTRGSGFVLGPSGSSFEQMQVVGDETIILGWEKLTRYDAAGVLVSSFGTSGQLDLATVVGGGGTALRVQPDGMIVVAAKKSLSPYEWIVARFDANGAPDPTFGTDGIVEVSPGATQVGTAPVGVRFQQNGTDLDIVVVGAGGGLQNNVGIVRLNPDGSLDTGFGSGGKVFESQAMAPLGMDIQSDGKILIQGRDEVLRYTTDGALDAAFATNGRWDLSIAAVIQGIHVLPDNDILVMGEVSANAYLFRLTPDGASDVSFAGGGLATYDFGLGDRFIAATEDASGKLILVGHQRTPAGNREFLVVRMSGAGVLDPDFGHGGYLLEAEANEAQDVGIDSQGRIIVGGENVNSSGSGRIHMTRHITGQ